MTSAEERLEGRLRSGLREVAESVTFVEGAGFVPAAPLTTTPSGRRRRTLFLATACVSLVLVVGVVAVIIRSAQPARNVTVNPTTGPNGQPSGSLLPIATEKIFPGLSQVMQRVHDYERGDGHVAYGEIVATTVGKTDVLFGIQPKFDASPVYVVRLVGTFACNTCSTPPHAVGPHGSEIVFTYSRVVGVPPGRFQIGNGPTDLSQFGRVYRLPFSSSDTVTVAPSPSGIGARTAAAAVPYVKGLVSTGRLPHASAVRRVWADGAIIVLSTTLTDHAAAEDLYERLSTAAGCDDSYLLVKGYRVVLQGGSQVTAPRSGYKTCAGT